MLERHHPGEAHPSMGMAVPQEISRKKTAISSDAFDVELLITSTLVTPLGHTSSALQPI